MTVTSHSGTEPSNEVGSNGAIMNKKHGVLLCDDKCWSVVLNLTKGPLCDDHLGRTENS
jgi:hypothetical protein